MYRPRRPERTVVYRLFDEHFESYVREYEKRYEAREGSLRRVAVSVHGPRGSLLIGLRLAAHRSVVAGLMTNDTSPTPTKPTVDVGAMLGTILVGFVLDASRALDHIFTA